MTEAALRYELTQDRLDNGLQVVVAPDPAAPGVAVNLWVEVGSADEAPGRTGFAHLFEHLMFQGSANVASGEHMATVESLGGTVNATTSTDRTNYFETVPRGALELALWMEADRFSSLAITPGNFEAQRQVVKEEKRQRYDNQPYGDLLELLTAQHFPADHPYGHLTIGSMTDLDDASPADVAEFFDAWYRAEQPAARALRPRHRRRGRRTGRALLRRAARAHKASTGSRCPSAPSRTPRWCLCAGPCRTPWRTSRGPLPQRRTRTSRRSTSPSLCSPTGTPPACTALWSGTVMSRTRCTARP